MRNVSFASLSPTLVVEISKIERIVLRFHAKCGKLLSRTEWPRVHLFKLLVKYTVVFFSGVLRKRIFVKNCCNRLFFDCMENWCVQPAPPGAELPNSLLFEKNPGDGGDGRNPVITISVAPLLFFSKFGPVGLSFMCTHKCGASGSTNHVPYPLPRRVNARIPHRSSFLI